MVDGRPRLQIRRHATDQAAGIEPFLVPCRLAAPVAAKKAQMTAEEQERAPRRR